MSGIRLHHCPQSRSMRTLWLLHELGVDAEVVVHPFDRSLRAPDYLALSPAGRVPALEIDGRTLFETGAITEYLCERFPDAGMGCAPGDPARADWLIWLHFAETLSQHSAALTQQHVMLYEDHMRSPVVMKLEAARLGKCYAALEARLSEGAGRDWLAAERFTAADLSVAQALYMARHFAPLDGHARLVDWYARATDRPAFAAALPKDGEARLYAQDFYAAWPMDTAGTA
ncbi:glutathione S-transferase [Roseivivax marinus]|uniref:glutathione S-transferase family protein n=1 Tax=Roseivivax marinus TaxID=1379903 RepID=UPI0008D6E6AA|nr:glutathione S-transferase family protein [Roseivivax marinus]SEL48091.1 glutathione S-transferase [Roseivivax marinus]